MDGGIIEDQITYYDERANEYDDTMWRSSLLGEGDLRDLEAAFDRFRPTGRVLEIGCGTGRWTVRLAAYAEELHALDSSARMIQRAREKVDFPHVNYQQTDVFRWEPDGVYDVVFFSFWLSHVPASHFEDFWKLVDRALAQDGRIFFIDEGPHDEYEEDWVDGEVVERTLLDGTVHRLVKKFWEPAELEERVSTLGWNVRVTRDARPRFFWGEGGRAS